MDPRCTVARLEESASPRVGISPQSQGRLPAEAGRALRDTSYFPAQNWWFHEL